MSKTKELHLYPSKISSSAILSWDESIVSIEEGEEFIESTQVGLIYQNPWGKGYDVFVHDFDGAVRKIMSPEEL